MKFQKRTIQDVKEDIKKNSDCIQMMLLYWSLCPRTLENRQKIKNLEVLFQKVLSVFQKTNLDTASTFVNEQLFLIKYSQNCRVQKNEENIPKNKEVVVELRDQDQLTQSSIYSNQAIPQEDQQQESFELQQDNISLEDVDHEDNTYDFQIDPKLHVLEKNFSLGLFENCSEHKNFQKFEEINQDNFFELMIDFYMLITVNYFTGSFSDFWQYVFLKIHSFYTQIEQEKNEVVIQQKIQLERIPGQKEPYLLNCFERINFEKYVFQDVINGTLGYRLKEIDEIQQIGTFFDQQLSEYVLNLKNQDLKKVNVFLKQQKLFYVLFNIKPQNTQTQFSPLTYKKYLFELIQYKEDNKKGYINMLNNQKEDQIDLIERFDRLFNEKKDPYYIKTIKKCLFEYSSQNFKVNVSRANKYNFWFRKMNWSEEILQNQKIVNFDIPEYNQIPSSEQNHKITHFQQTEFQILYENVQKEDMRILLLGKFNNNKRQIGKNLCKFLDVEYFDLDELVQEFVKKQIELSENPEEQSVQEDDDQKEQQTEEKTISEDEQEFNNIMTGKELSKKFLLVLIKRKIEECYNNGKGFIFNVTSNLHENEYFVDVLEQNAFQNFTPFTFIINLEKDDDQVQNESELTIQKLIQSEDDEGNQIEQLKFYTEENIFKNQMQFKRAQWFQQQEENFSDEFKEKLEELPEEMQQQIKDIEKNVLINTNNSFKKTTNDKNNKIIKKYRSGLLNKVAEYQSFKNVQQIVVKNQHKNQEEVIRNIIEKLDYQKQQKCEDLEQADLKDLLLQNREEEQYDVSRRWSYFRNIDPVSFINENVIIEGSEEFAVEYQNNIFLFGNENNKNIFKNNPKKYLCKIPKLKSNTNISLIAPDGCKLKTLAQALSKKYSLEIVDLSTIIEQIKYILQNDKLDKEKKQTEESMFAQYYIKNVNLIYDQLMEGKSVSIEDLLKIFAYQNGEQFEVVFCKESEIQNIMDLQSKKKNKKPKKAQKQKNIPFSEFNTVYQNQQLICEFYEQILEEIPEGLEEEFIKEQYEIFKTTLIQKTQKKGYIFINFPTNEDTKKVLSLYGYEIDKVINFDKEDLNEYVPYIEKVQEYFNIENHLQENEQIQQFLQEVYEEKNVLKLDMDIQAQTKVIQIQIEDFINPFKQKIDSQIYQREYNVQEINEDIEPVLFYKYADYCPYNLIEKGWFTKGSYEFQDRIDNQIILFLTEQNQQHFQKNYQQILNKSQNLDFLFKQKSRYFITGTIGSGLNIFTQFISDKYSLKVIHVKKQALEQKLSIMKQFVQEQYYRKQFDWEEQEENEKQIDFDNIEYIIQEYQPEDDKEEKIEQQIIQELFLNNENVLFNVDFGLNEQEKQIFKKDVIDILKEQNLMFDHVLILKSSEQNSLDRLYNESEIKTKFDENIKQLDEKKLKLIEEKRQEIYQQKLEEIGEDEEKPSIEDIEVDQNDIDMEDYPVLEDELEKVKNSIIEKRTLQEEYQETLIQALADYRSKIFLINTDLNIKKIQERIDNKIETLQNYYKNCFTKSQIFSVQDSQQNDELTCEKKIEKLLKSGQYSLSQYKFNNFYDLSQKVQSYDFNFVYKNKIYFTNSKQQLQSIHENLSLLENTIDFKENMQKIGIFSLFKLPEEIKQRLQQQLQIQIYSYKEILCQIFEDVKFDDLQELNEQSYDFIFSQINQILFQDCDIKDQYKFKHFSIYLKKLKEKYLSDVLDNKEKIYLLKVWLEKYENQKNGYFITNFPENLEQAQLLQREKINPSMIITTQFTSKDIIEDFVKNQEKLYKQQNPLKVLQIDENEDDEEKIKQLEEEIKIAKEQYENELEKQRLNFIKQSTECVYQINTDIKMVEYFYSSSLSNLYSLNRNKSKFSNFLILAKLIQKIQQAKINQQNNLIKNDFFITQDLCLTKNFIEQNLGQTFKFDFCNWQKQKTFQITDDKYQKYFYYKDFIYVYDQNLVEQENQILSQVKCSKINLNQTLKFAQLQQDLQIQKNLQENIQFQGYCCICLSQNKFEKGFEYLTLQLRNQNYQFCSMQHFQNFVSNPVLYTYQKLDEQKLQRYLKGKFFEKSTKEKLVDEIIAGLNQTMIKKPKYPNLNTKESYLKFFSIYLKMRNPLQNQNYRQNNQQKLTQYLKQTQLIKKVKNSFKTRINWTKKQEQEFQDQIKLIIQDDTIMSNDKKEYFKTKLYQLIIQIMILLHYSFFLQLLRKRTQTKNIFHM